MIYPGQAVDRALDDFNLGGAVYCVRQSKGTHW